MYRAALYLEGLREADLDGHPVLGTHDLQVGDLRHVVGPHQLGVVLSPYHLEGKNTERRLEAGKQYRTLWPGLRPHRLEKYPRQTLRDGETIPGTAAGSEQ